MIPKECKRLAEVDFPIAVVSKHAVREKSIRHGHPSTLHLWWARRPLAACRAVLMALLLPDPCDALCPVDFKEKARDLLPRVQGAVGPKDEDLRRALLKFIGDFANWDLSAEPAYLEVARGLVKAAHPEETPLVVDPFAGGGSIPLEALRLGCEAFASDLNPVACLILKVLLEDIPRHGPELAEELRRVGAEIKQAAEKELAEFYPADPDGSKPIAYLWARTVRCEAPNCGAQIPLVRSFWLSKKGSRKRALRYRVMRLAGLSPRVEFEVFEPKAEKDVPGGTVTRAKATCIACGAVLQPERVRAQLTAQRGGADVIFDVKGNRGGGALLLAAVMHKPGQQGRRYRTANREDYRAVYRASKQLEKLASAPLVNGLAPLPTEPLGRVPVRFGVINVWVYGMDQWASLFSARQQLALSTIGRIVGEPDWGPLHGLLAISLGKVIDFNSSVAKWAPGRETSAATFGRPALPMMWDYCETVPISSSTGSIEGAIEYAANVARSIAMAYVQPGQSGQEDARSSHLPDQSVDVWFTDPPYYDNVPYSYISDFFYVWLKRALRSYYPQLLSGKLTPKSDEIVAYTESGDQASDANRRFVVKLTAGFAEGRRILKEDSIGCVVFAHQSTEGWEALLSGLIRGGWVITASWPIATERAGRPRAYESAALNTSVHLVCRARAGDKIGDWGEVLRELPRRVGDWMERLQSEGIRGADLVFACIGPALEIFSRYSRVETAEGREVQLPEYLEKVWEVVGRTALQQVLGTAEATARNSAAGALEEDARLTALFLWTLQSTNGGDAAPSAAEADDEEESEDDEEESGSGKKKRGFTLIYDVVRRFAQPLGIHLDDWKGRVIEIEKGVVRLLPVAERAKQLFGTEGATVVADRIEREPTAQLQLALFGEAGAAPEIKAKGRGRKKAAGPASDRPLETRREATTLDRVHAAMLLQASGRTNALRALLKAEQERGPDFLRLANALSALYPKSSEEKRLLDAMLLAAPR